MKVDQLRLLEQSNRTCDKYVQEFKKVVDKQGFKLEKLSRPIKIRNIDGIDNSRGSVTHEVEVNIYFKGHVE